MTTAPFPGIPERFSADWKAIRSSVAELQLFWRFHLRFCGDKQDVATMEKILQVPYYIIRKALLFTIVMQVRNLLDQPRDHTGRDNVSLIRFVGLFKQDYGELSSKLSTLLQGIITHCRDIKKWGNRRIGHADLRTVLGAEALPGISQQNFETAQMMMRDLLREVHIHFHGPESPTDLPELTDGADKLLSYIRAGYRAEVAEIESML
jgi:hypothetical protein